MVVPGAPGERAKSACQLGETICDDMIDHGGLDLSHGQCSRQIESRTKRSRDGRRNLAHTVVLWNPKEN